MITLDFEAHDRRVIDDLESRIAALEAHNKLWQQNMREAYEAFSAMRNDLNELFPMQSAEADLLEGTEWSIACSAIVDAARNKFSTLEARLAERVKVESLDNATQQKLREALRFSASRSVLSSEDERRILSALEATPPAPKVTEAEAGEKLANAMWGITLTAAQESGE